MSALPKLVPLKPAAPAPSGGGGGGDDSSMDEDAFMQAIFDPNLDEQPTAAVKPTGGAKRPAAKAATASTDADFAPAAAAFGRPNGGSRVSATSSSAASSGDALESLVGSGKRGSVAAAPVAAAVSGGTLSNSSSQSDLNGACVRDFCTVERPCVLKITPADVFPIQTASQS